MRKPTADKKGQTAFYLDQSSLERLRQVAFNLGDQSLSATVRFLVAKEYAEQQKTPAA